MGIEYQRKPLHQTWQAGKPGGNRQNPKRFRAGTIIGMNGRAMPCLITRGQDSGQIIIFH